MIMMDITVVNGLYKPLQNWGASPCTLWQETWLGNPCAVLLLGKSSK